MVHCFGEPPVRSLCFYSFLMCIFICQCPSFCCCIFIWLPGYFTMSPALHPGFSGPWRPPPALSSTLTTVITFSFSSTRALRIWVGVFYPQAFFTLCSFQTFLAQPAFIKASLGAGSYSLKFLGIHTDPRNAEPAHLFVWFTAIHNLVFIYVNIAKVLLVVKSLIRLAATLFSSHENINQLPN